MAHFSEVFFSIMDTLAVASYYLDSIPAAISMGLWALIGWKFLNQTLFITSVLVGCIISYFVLFAYPRSHAGAFQTWIHQVVKEVLLHSSVGLAFSTILYPCLICCVFEQCDNILSLLRTLGVLYLVPRVYHEDSPVADLYDCYVEHLPFNVAKLENLMAQIVALNENNKAENKALEVEKTKANAVRTRAIDFYDRSIRLHKDIRMTRRNLPSLADLAIPEVITDIAKHANHFARQLKAELEVPSWTRIVTLTPRAIPRMEIRLEALYQQCDDIKRVRAIVKRNRLIFEQCEEQWRTTLDRYSDMAETPLKQKQRREASKQSVKNSFAQHKAAKFARVEPHPKSRYIPFNPDFDYQHQLKRTSPLGFLHPVVEHRREHKPKQPQEPEPPSDSEAENGNNAEYGAPSKPITDPSFLIPAPQKATHELVEIPVEAAVEVTSSATVVQLKPEQKQVPVQETSQGSRIEIQPVEPTQPTQSTQAVQQLPAQGKTPQAEQKANENE